MIKDNFLCYIHTHPAYISVLRYVNLKIAQLSYVNIKYLDIIYLPEAFYICDIHKTLITSISLSLYYCIAGSSVSMTNAILFENLYIPSRFKPTFIHDFLSFKNLRGKIKESMTALRKFHGRHVCNGQRM